MSNNLEELKWFYARLPWCKPSDLEPDIAGMMETLGIDRQRAVELLLESARRKRYDVATIEVAEEAKVAS